MCKEGLHHFYMSILGCQKERSCPTLISQMDVNQAETRDGATPLYMASQDGHVEVVKALLTHQQIDVNKARTKYGDTPILIASANGHEQVVKVLIVDPRVNVNQARATDGATPLFIASLNRHVEMVKGLHHFNMSISGCH